MPRGKRRAANTDISPDEDRHSSKRSRNSANAAANNTHQKWVKKCIILVLFLFWSVLARSLGNYEWEFEDFREGFGMEGLGTETRVESVPPTAHSTSKVFHYQWKVSCFGVYFASASFFVPYFYYENENSKNPFFKIFFQQKGCNR